jgi:di/tricarboxylate transporter
MTTEMLVVFSIVGIASVLFASGRVRLDVVALLVVLALTLSGILSVRESLSGFGDPVVILVAGLLVLGEALARTGVAFSIGQWLTRIGGDGEVRMIVLLMLASSLLGSVMSSTAIVAVFIPVVLNIAAKTNLNASRLLIPMSYAALISGMLTLIATTPNLVVSEELGNFAYESFNFFSFTPIGAAVLLAAIVFMAVVGRFLLPGDRMSARKSQALGIQDLLSEFRTRESARLFRVSESSVLVGKTLAQAELGDLHRTWITVVARTVDGRVRLFATPDADFELLAGDSIAFTSPGDGELDPVVAAQLGLEPEEIRDKFETWSREIGTASVLMHPQSSMIGQTVRQSKLRGRYGVMVLGIKHRGELVERFLDHELESGDALLVLGSWQDIGGLQVESHDFVVLTMPVEMDQVAPARDRAPHALLILAGMVLLSALEIVPVVIAVLIAALAAVFTRCLSMDQAYRSIHWSSVVLIAGMLPIADALIKTGGVVLLAELLDSQMGEYGPYVMMSVLFFLSALLGLFLSNTATAILMAPIAIGAAQAMGIEPYAFAMTVAIAASAAFATPVSTPVVTLVVEPGHYRFLDFVKVGVPLVLITWGVTLLLTPMLFPF